LAIPFRYPLVGWFWDEMDMRLALGVSDFLIQYEHEMGKAFCGPHVTSGRLVALDQNGLNFDRRPARVEYSTPPIDKFIQGPTWRACRPATSYFLFGVGAMRLLIASRSLDSQTAGITSLALLLQIDVRPLVIS
jgi:hypothetical protein